MSPAPESGPVSAVVQTGSYETAYRRAGRGLPVLLLVGATPPHERSDLFALLARAYRVVEPTVPAALPISCAPAGEQGTEEQILDLREEVWAEWMRGVVDGLGLDRPTLVVDTAHATVAASFARFDPHRCGPVVVVQPGGDAETLIGQIERTHQARTRSDPGP